MIQCQAIARQDELQGNLFSAKQYKDIGTFLTAANQLKGLQKSETQESLLPPFSVCLARKVAFCKKPNVFINSTLASSLSPSLFFHKSPGYDFNEIEDIPPSKLHTEFLKTGFKEMLLPDEIQSSCTTLAGKTARMPPKSESLSQPNWKCINIPIQEGLAAVETVPYIM